MKKYLPLAVACLLPSLAQAAPVMSQPGSLMTTGTGSTTQTGLSVLYNPAAGEMVIQEGESFRWGYVSSIGFSFEVGDANNFTDDVNELTDTLDSDNVTAEEGNEVINNYNDNLRQKLGEEGYLKIGAHIVAPLAPFLIRSELLGGVLSIDAMAGVSARVSILDDEITVNTFTNQFETNTAIYTNLGLAYSREIDHNLVKGFTDKLGGRLLAGVRGNLYSMSLSKQVVGLLNIDEDDELGDVIQDDLSANKVSTTNIGLDLGIIWEAPNYHVGFNWRNINEPEFDYGTLGQGCSSKDSSTSMSNCYTALYFAAQDRITLDESYTMTAQTTVDAALNTENKRWRLATSYDLQPMRDPVGDEYQWASVSAAYVGSTILGARVGLSKNQTGTNLTMVNAGLSLFGGMNLDLRYSLEKIEVDGASAPRAFAVNLGFENSF